MMAASVVNSVNESLPVHVIDEDIEKYPECAKLLTSLSKLISGNGSSYQLHMELQLAEEKLKNEKENWFVQQILYQELQDMLIDSDLKAQERNLSQADLEVLESVKKSLTLAEIGNYLDCNTCSNSDVTMLGLTEERIHERNPKNFLPSQIMPEIEKRLRKKCEDLAFFYDPSKKSDKRDLNFAKVFQLPSFIERDFSELEEKETELQQTRLNNKKKLQLYHQALLNSLEILQKIYQCRIKIQSKYNKETHPWLVEKFKAITLKAKLLELEILNDTYTTDSVEALKQIRKYLDSGMEKTKKEQMQTSLLLNTYQNLGFEFDALVDECTKLESEIENKVWALDQFKKCSSD